MYETNDYLRSAQIILAPETGSYYMQTAMNNSNQEKNIFTSGHGLYKFTRMTCT